jgi:hypothetical protein
MGSGYRITSISDWFDVRANRRNNDVIGCGNSPDEAVTDAINQLQKNNKRLQKLVEELKKENEILKK